MTNFHSDQWGVTIYYLNLAEKNGGGMAGVTIDRAT